MEKRLLLAMALSLLLVYVWSGSVPKTAQKTPIVQTQPIPSSKPMLETGLTTESIETEPLVDFSLDKSKIKFIISKAAIKEIRFDDYLSSALFLNYGLLLQDKDLVFEMVSSSEQEIVFVHKDKNKEIIKRFNFSKSNYDMGLEIEFKNLSSDSLNFNIPLLLCLLNFTQSPADAQFFDVTAGLEEKTVHVSARKNTVLDKIKFLGVRNKYFCGIIEPDSGDYSAFINKENSQEYAIGVKTKDLVLVPGQSITKKFRIYLGPQDLNIISSSNPAWGSIVHYGAFDFIAQIFVQILKFFYGFAHNWGVAVILLTIAIQIMLYPLSIKQAHSMHKMQALQPELEIIRKKYKDNPQKFQKESMELYRTHKVNPYGGCLTMILQMPIFVAFLQVQNRLIYLKGASFLWIKDLSMPDKLLTITKPMVFSVNIIPIFMAAVMFIQMKFSLQKMSAEASEQQKMMGLMLPVMLLLFLYNTSSAFNLYMLITNLFMLFFQIKINKIISKDNGQKT